MLEILVSSEPGSPKRVLASVGSQGRSSPTTSSHSHSRSPNRTVYSITRIDRGRQPPWHAPCTERARRPSRHAHVPATRQRPSTAKAGARPASPCPELAPRHEHRMRVWGGRSRLACGRQGAPPQGTRAPRSIVVKLSLDWRRDSIR
jgi:hypothetical protein